MGRIWFDVVGLGSDLATAHYPQHRFKPRHQRLGCLDYRFDPTAKILASARSVPGSQTTRNLDGNKCLV
jgi:hypothetical protein